MTENWFRWHVGTASDPKWRLIARISGQPEAVVLGVWATMLERAACQGGVIDGWDHEVAAAGLGVATEAVEAIFDAMQGRTLSDLSIIKWRQRQPLREDSSAERTRAYRDRKRDAEAVTVTPRDDLTEDPKETDRSVTGGDAAKHTVTLGDAAVTRRDARGDKRREERKNTPPAHAGPPLREPDEAGEGDGVAGAPLTDQAPAKPKRGTRLPRDWTPADEDRSFAKQRGFTEEQIDDLRDEFRDYWSGVAGARGLKLDWSGTWRNRVRDRSGGGSGPAGGNDRRGGRQGSSSFLEAAARFAARHS